MSTRLNWVFQNAEQKTKKADYVRMQYQRLFFNLLAVFQSINSSQYISFNLFIYLLVFRDPTCWLLILFLERLVPHSESAYLSLYPELYSLVFLPEVSGFQV